MWELNSTPRALFGSFVRIAQLFEELIVRFPELQAVQPIPSLRRELDCGEILGTFCHGDPLDHIILYAHIVLCVVNPKRPAVPVPPRITERIWMEAVGGSKFTLFPPDSQPRPLRMGEQSGDLTVNYSR